MKQHPYIVTQTPEGHSQLKANPEYKQVENDQFEERIADIKKTIAEEVEEVLEWNDNCLTNLEIYNIE